MTKLVRKLKQLVKKRAHRKTVQKRKVERIQRDFDRDKERQAARLERETEKEMARLRGEDVSDAEAEEDQHVRTAEINKRIVRVVGDLILDAPARKSKKQLTRKQAKRQTKQKERGEAITDMISKKWDHKKRRVKVRAQIRNENLH